MRRYANPADGLLVLGVVLVPVGVSETFGLGPATIALGALILLAAFLLGRVGE